MRSRYVYPCILCYENEKIVARFPDFEECTATGTTEEEVIFNAKESLGLCLYGLEVDEEFIPKPTTLINVQVNKDEVLTLVDVYMPLFREIAKERSVKKTLTIPKWLDEASLKHGINFSRVLQEALKEKIGIQRNR